MCGGTIDFRVVLACRTGRVYPRVCGGTVIVHCIGIPNNGLSPRVRGNLHAQGHADHFRRSIPACAGEPSYPLLAVFDHVPAVYPRVCGGTFMHQGGGVQSGRSIPACAGEPSCPGPCRPISGGLSPRVRGNLVQRQEDAGMAGSIPACAWEPSTHCWRCSAVGSIPACAGEPLAAPALISRIRVYPRVCGGTLRDSQRMLVAEGLSPRVRGNPLSPVYSGL